MIEIVSMNTLSAREPDHRATEPIEIRSGRPPSKTSLRVFLMTSVNYVRGEHVTRPVEDALLGLGDDVLTDPVAEIADRPDQAEQQRRQGQQREEARLGGQPGDAVAEAVGHGLAGEPPHDVSRTSGERRPGPSSPSNGLRGHGSTVGHVSAPTHEVTNQPPPLVGHDVLRADRRARRRFRGVRPPGAVESLRRSAAGAAASRRSAGASRPTRTHRRCARTTATATAWTRSTSTRPGTDCCPVGVAAAPEPVALGLGRRAQRPGRAA